MTGNAGNLVGRWPGSRWRMAAWGGAAALLSLPLVAMQFTDEVAWDLADFVLAGALVAGVGVTYELTARATGNRAWRAAVAVALAAAFIPVWVNLAVGIIGDEGNPANLMFFGVVAVAAVAAVAARFRPPGMTRAMVATALAQALVAVIAVLGGMGYPASSPLEILGLNAFFVALWLLSAWLFRRAARQQAAAGAAP